MHLLKLFAACLCLCLLVHCSDESERECFEEGAQEEAGPMCCPGHCGASTQLKTKRICSGGKWICQPGVVEDACASYNGCQIKQNCSYDPGMGQEEPDPVSELCCVGGCDGTKAVRRVCKSGLAFECPNNAVPISKNCKKDSNDDGIPDYVTACGGILAKYKANKFKLPK